MRVRKLVMISIATVVLLVAAALAAALAIAPSRPAAALESIRAPFVAQDYRDLPAAESFRARDGQALATRFYPSAARKIAVLIHGSSSHGRSMHALARHLARNETAQVYALDMRGHGASGLHGDIAYLGQLEDDRADFLAFARPGHAGLPFVLTGFSSGGGFVLRVAGGPLGDRFDAYLLLAPFLRYNAPTSRNTGSSPWASVSVPRIVGLTLLERMRIPAFQGLRVVEFAVPDTERENLTASYSYRLNSNFGPHWDYAADFRHTTKPMVVLAGAQDELFYADRFASTVQPLADKVRVELVPGVNHAGLVTQPEALAAIQRVVQRLP